jgi:arylsulfatase A-like enzyme
VITDRFKLVHYYKADIDEWELYDRKADPNETRNFINDPQHAETIASLRAELARLRADLEVPDEAPRAAYGKHPFDIPTRWGGPVAR